jgi:hypothetical protein
MMRLAGEGIMRQQTWFAVIVCIIAVIPGFIVGALAKALMQVLGGWAENSDFLYLRALFDFETPGALYNFIFAGAVPNGMQGLTAGFVAVWIVEKVAKGANYGLSATITGALYTGFLLCLIVITLAKLGITQEMLLSICQGVRLWIGLASAAAGLPAPSRVMI